MKELLEYLKVIIVDAPKEFWKEATAFLINKIDRYKIKRAIEESRKYTQIDKKKRYVIRDMKGNPIGLTSLQIRKLKRQGILPKYVNAVYIEKNSIAIVKYKPETNEIIKEN